ncbi:hypothetical protein GWI33_006542, partial [Rhynchophorus ferrugineus]
KLYRCNEETCIGLSSGTATPVNSEDLCTCRCHSHLPAYREDLGICVDDFNDVGIDVNAKDGGELSMLEKRFLR